MKPNSVQGCSIPEPAFPIGLPKGQGQGNGVRDTEAAHDRAETEIRAKLADPQRLGAPEPLGTLLPLLSPQGGNRQEARPHMLSADLSAHLIVMSDRIQESKPQPVRVRRDTL